MTSEAFYYIAYFFGVLLFSFGVAFAWWTKVRVIWFRQDIYDLRDRLFMEGARLGCADDEASRYARDHLNTLARIAPVLSIPIVMHASKLELAEVRKLPKSNNPTLAKTIETVMCKADMRIRRYLLNETLTGLSIRALCRLISMRWLVQDLVASAKKWRESQSPEEALRLLENDYRANRWAAF